MTQEWVHPFSPDSLMGRLARGYLTPDEVIAAVRERRMERGEITMTADAWEKLRVGDELQPSGTKDRAALPPVKIISLRHRKDGTLDGVWAKRKGGGQFYISSVRAEQFAAVLPQLRIPGV